MRGEELASAGALKGEVWNGEESWLIIFCAVVSVKFHVRAAMVCGVNPGRGCVSYLGRRGISTAVCETWRIPAMLARGEFG